MSRVQRIAFIGFGEAGDLPGHLVSRAVAAARRAA
jgi:hypothetical protein